jgi:hypothetical protein
MVTFWHLWNLAVACWCFYVFSGLEKLYEKYGFVIILVFAAVTVCYFLGFKMLFSLFGKKQRFLTLSEEISAVLVLVVAGMCVLSFFLAIF